MIEKIDKYRNSSRRLYSCQSRGARHNKTAITQQTKKKIMKRLLSYLLLELVFAAVSYYYYSTKS